MFEYNFKHQCIFHMSSEIRNKSSYLLKVRNLTGKIKISILSTHASKKFRKNYHSFLMDKASFAFSSGPRGKGICHITFFSKPLKT